MIKEFTTAGRFSFDTQVAVNQRLVNAVLGLANNCNQAMAFTHSTGNSEHMEEFRKELINTLRVLQRVSKEIKEHKESQQIDFPSAFSLTDFDQAA